MYFLRFNVTRLQALFCWFLTGFWAFSRLYKPTCIQMWKSGDLANFEPNFAVASAPKMAEIWQFVTWQAACKLILWVFIQYKSRDESIRLKIRVFWVQVVDFIGFTCRFSFRKKWQIWKWPWVGKNSVNLFLLSFYLCAFAKSCSNFGAFFLSCSRGHPLLDLQLAFSTVYGNNFPAVTPCKSRTCVKSPTHFEKFK